MSNNQLLYQFLKAYLEWVYAGANLHHVFSRNNALCAHFKRYMFNVLVYESQRHIQCRHLRKQFIWSGLDPDFPFDHSAINFIDAGVDGKHHLNAERNAWALNFLVTNNADLPRHS